MNQNKVVGGSESPGDRENRVPCPHCQGQGVVTITQNRAGSPPSSNEVPCPVCRGTKHAGLIKK